MQKSSIISMLFIPAAADLTFTYTATYFSCCYFTEQFYNLCESLTFATKFRPSAFLIKIIKCSQKNRILCCLLSKPTEYMIMLLASQYFEFRPYRLTEKN